MIGRAVSDIVGTAATGNWGASGIRWTTSATRSGSDGIADAQHWCPAAASLVGLAWCVPIDAQCSDATGTAIAGASGPITSAISANRARKSRTVSS